LQRLQIILSLFSQKVHLATANVVALFNIALFVTSTQFRDKTNQKHCSIREFCMEYSPNWIHDSRRVTRGEILSPTRMRINWCRIKQVLFCLHASTLSLPETDTIQRMKYTSNASCYYEWVEFKFLLLNWPRKEFLYYFSCFFHFLFFILRFAALFSTLKLMSLGKWSTNK
jgi:hypothetical protein